MADRAQSAKPIMTDAAIRERTGKNWAQWFAALDKAGAAKLDHKAIAAMLNDRMDVGPWWGQMIAVSYERARGLRAMNQKCDGQFSVSVSKTLSVELAKLYAATADEAVRSCWFPKGGFKLSSQTRDKYFRGAWGKNGARLEINFYDKGEGKSQINVQVNRLESSAAVEAERETWKKALAKLAANLA
jgi:hypothetical protein